MYEVTSCAQGDGKSVLALTLARWMVTTGRRSTLLVDADLRRPAILREADSTTAASPLTGPDWAGQQPIRTEAATGLAIFSLDELEVDPFTAILRLGEVLEPLRAEFDVIIVDTPPVLAVPDALSIGRHVDQVLFVVRWAATRRRSLSYALDRFDADTRAKIRLVFNRVDPKGYRRYEAPGAERYSGFAGRGYAALRHRRGAAGPAGGLAAGTARR